MKAVIFDYDGTLVRLNINFDMMRRGVESLLIQYGIESGSLKGLLILEMIDEAEKRISEENPLKGSSFLQRALKFVADHEVMAAKAGQILPGVTSMIERLRELGIKVGVITRNCDTAVKIVFPDIERYCDIYLPRDCVTHVKPHPDHLSLALERMSVHDPDQCFMVGDHTLDIEAGKRLNMKTAGVMTGKTTRRQFLEAGADLVLEDATKILHQFTGGPNS